MDISHGELHLLWITVDELIIITVYLWVVGYTSLLPIVFLILIGVIFAISATIADIRQHQLECHLLKIANKQENLSPFLKELGYISK